MGERKGRDYIVWENEGGRAAQIEVRWVVGRSDHQTHTSTERMWEVGKALSISTPPTSDVHIV